MPCNATDCRTEGDAGDWCDRYATEEYGSEGDDLQCFIVETGSSEGFCSKKGMLWVAGIIMSLAGSLLSNFGLQVQKVAYNKSEKEIHEGLEGEEPIPLAHPQLVPQRTHRPARLLARSGAPRSPGDEHPRAEEDGQQRRRQREAS